jgi:hypothetical protein
MPNSRGSRAPWPTLADLLRAFPRAVGILTLALLFTIGACIGVCAPWNT